MALSWLRGLPSFQSSHSSTVFRRSPSRRCCRPSLETLETRVVPTSYTWIQTGAGTFNWNSAANWSPNTGFPNATGDTANITSALAGNETINLNQAITVGTLNIGAFSGTKTFTVAANGGSLTLGGSATIGKTGGGSDVISAPITLNAATSINDTSSTGMTFSGIISGSRNLTLTGGAAADVLSGANTYSGTTTIEGPCNSAVPPHGKRQRHPDGKWHA